MNVATVAQEHVGRGLWQAYCHPQSHSFLNPCSSHSIVWDTDEVELQGPTHTWVLGSPDTDPTAPTTDWNSDDKLFREGKGTMHWIQDRNIPVQLSLLVKWGPRISAEDTFHQMSIKLIILLLPALDCYSKDITQRAHSSRLQDCIQPSMWGSQNMAELQLSSAYTHHACKQITCLPSQKRWRGKKDQQDIHVDCKAPTSQATLDSLLHPQSSCIWPPSNTKSLTITAAVMNQTEVCSNWLKPDMPRLLFIDPIKCQPN